MALQNTDQGSCSWCPAQGPCPQLLENEGTLLAGSAPDWALMQYLEASGAGRDSVTCCACHNAQPGTPLATMLAMLETAQPS